MAKHIIQEGTLTLPDIFKDRTMNLFTLSDNGASEFTFVVSRASAKSDEDVKSVALRLVKELEVTVPAFHLESTGMTQVDGYPAAELFYQFRNDGGVIFQKQTVILLRDQPAGQKMVCYIGTCPGEFSDYYHRQYQEVMQSIKFHQAVEPRVGEMLRADNAGIFFALDGNTKVLSVFAGIQELYQHLPLQQAKEGVFLAFDQQGGPLKVAPVPDSDPVRYALWTLPGDESHHLLAHLAVCRQISGPDYLDTTDKIRRFVTAKRAD